MRKKKDIKRNIRTENLPAVIQPKARMCMNCVKGLPVGINGDVLCREKGIVTWDYCCPNHRFFYMEDLMKMEFYRCSNCEFFTFHPHPYIPSYGVCSLFSVRKCDGSAKKACSKFVKRKERNVS
ncbi:MAG TPA: hypothetical protein PLD49_00395 [Thermoclostridium caenicola]|uniref:Uncharacterized protein n=1 Tax=Thermoclostridium caenicola TaxID=659425 RepID=A0A1M6F3T1_9FIRM|nr:hypothetical protein [Thermoclostridium caenicola]SHI92322.1 hypothetical protein SAMN05444373_101518 [Thermoclostridium caenicola]HOK42115.1 hypothetical protein [Thermoclostridium caenicola]HOL84012.1 hypothetical protein [Thermoclostridium caenicola]HPO75594.1 hypothetical protein [Thermoclostridium caenicola]